MTPIESKLHDFLEKFAQFDSIEIDVPDLAYLLNRLKETTELNNKLVRILHNAHKTVESTKGYPTIQSEHVQDYVRRELFKALYHKELPI